MPRSLRIEYEDAYYHVMNRGRGRQTIFHSSAYYYAFMATLSEANHRFGMIVHCFCLMGNHYHLLLQTPNANLSRIMRHINGVYTQRYNRLKKTDGPLFRGRYKAIVVDKDAYLLQLSRYIHRNPIEAKTPLVEQLAQYSWSSYPAYIGKSTSPDWLSRNQVYDLLTKHASVSTYKKYVEQEVEDEIVTFYKNGNGRVILGDKHFREKVLTRNRKGMTERQKLQVLEKPTVEKIIEIVSGLFDVDSMTIIKKQLGRQKQNLARKMAYYLVQTNCDLKLQEIAIRFDVNHVGSVSNAISDIKHRIRNDKQMKKMLERALEMIQAT